MNYSRINLLRLMAFTCLINTSRKKEFSDAYRFLTGKNGGNSVWSYIYQHDENNIYNELKQNELR